MVYQGSKNRIAKDIIPFMTPFLNGNNYFIDMFCGGCNLIDKIDYPKRMANDKNEYLIALFKYLQQGGTLPEEVSKEEYYKVKANKENYEQWYVGHVGFNCSRLGKWFDCYVNEYNGRNYQREHNSNLIQQIDKLIDVHFYNKDYSELPIETDSVIYCDPPYRNTKKYKDKFDSDKFYDWCRNLSSKYGTKIFISEYEMPSDFKCIWSKEIKNTSDPKETSNPIEKLFVHKSIYNEVINK